MIRKIVEKIGFGGSFLLTAGTLYGIVGIYDFGLLRNVLHVLSGLMMRVVPLLLLVLAMMFLTNLFFNPERIVKFVGKGAGFRGWAVAILGGIASSGPIYMWYPLLSDLKKKGMKDSLTAAFLYNRAVKIPLLPMMVYYFGWPFTVVLSIYMVLFSAVNGVLVQRLAGKGSER